MAGTGIEADQAAWDDQCEALAARVWGSVLWLAFLAMLLHIIARPLDINHDAALLLHAGQLVIDGKIPYVGIVDVNPPMIMYLNALPAQIARMLSVNVIPVFSLSVWLIAVVSSLSLRTILLSAKVKRSEAEIIAVLWFSLSLMFRMLDLYHFGQREHLFVLLYLPFFAMRWVRWEGGRVGRGRAVALGVAVGLVTSLKPHFVLILLAPEIYWCISKRSFGNLVRLEVICLVSVGLAYVGHFFVVPGMREEFFGRWLPFIARVHGRWPPFIARGYGAYDSPLLSLVKNPEIIFAFAMTALPFLFSPARDDRLGRMSRPLAALTAASILVFFLQHKGWSYQAIPAQVGGVLILGIMVIQLARYLFQQAATVGLRSTLRTVAQVLAIPTYALIYFVAVGRWWSWNAIPLVCGPILFLVIALAHSLVMIAARRVEGVGSRLSLSVLAYLVPAAAAMALFLFAWTSRITYEALAGNRFAKVIYEHSEEGDPVLFISTSTDGEAYPTLVQMKRRPGSRYLVAFPIPLLYSGVTAKANTEFPYRIGQQAPIEERRFLRDLAEDIATIRPRLIFIDNDGRSVACPEGFDMKEYLVKAGFVGAAMWGYAPISEVAGFEAYVLQEGKDKELD